MQPLFFFHHLSPSAIHLFAYYVHCLFPASPHYNIISSIWAKFRLFCSLISLRADNGIWHLDDQYIFGEFNE